MNDASDQAREVSKEILDQKVNREIEELRLAGRLYKFEPEPRCKVCRQTSMLGIVNKLLAAGESYTNILKDLEPLNEPLDKRERVTYSSIRTHAQRHFNPDDAAAAVYRRILEKNAKAANIDFVDGIQTAVTPMAYLETTMNKGYQNLISQDGYVSVELGMRAALTLENMTREDGGEELRALVDKTNRLIEIVRSVVPVSYWEEIVRKLEAEEGEESEVVDAEVDEDDEDASFLDDIEEDEDDV